MAQHNIFIMGGDPSLCTPTRPPINTCDKTSGSYLGILLIIYSTKLDV